MLRIIAGEFRSRRLLTPPDAASTRPYAQRVKESVFNRLREWCEGARVLDLFAGVGTMGLEAVSRGAAVAVMVERDRGVFRLLEKNVAALDCAGRVRLVHADALAPGALLRAEPPVDLVFVDPPYAMMRDEGPRGRVLEQMARCRSLLASPSLLVLRSPLSPDEADLAIPGLVGPEAHRYGPSMWVLFYEPAAALDHE